MDSLNIRFLTLALAGVLAVAAPAPGGDFRVETKIYVGDEEASVVENLTLFAGDVVYDFLLTRPKEIIVYDSKRGRFMLLDQEHRVQCTVLADQLRQFAAAIQAYDDRGPMAFFLDPDFETAVEEDSGSLVLSSEHMTYRVKGVQPESPDGVDRYRQFSDWCARLNAVRPGNLPPFARLKLNKAVAEKGWIPTEVERSIQFASLRPGGKQLVRSKHATVWRLSNTDRQRIAETGNFQASFQVVGLQEYQRLASAGVEGDSPTQ